MAQVLHMDSGFPGKPSPTTPTAFRGKDPEPPYSVETPYGYRLDLDFLKYVDDIEKGHTIKRVAVHRRPRLGSLPRGPGYTGSWWTSTESLCSNTSADSRHSAYSYCGRGFYPQYGALETRAGFNPRVERTLLDARKKLEDQADSGEGSQPRVAGLGSLTPSVSGSTSSLVGAGLPPPPLGRLQSHNGTPYTPLSSGLSTPVSPTPGHLQHVREQMAGALQKLRQLEEQVKLIPVLQVKISVLQEEKRQLSVQLKSQKFLGHAGGSGGGRGWGRGELFLDLPEEGVPAGPEPLPLGQADVGKKRETRAVGVGPEEGDGSRPGPTQRSVSTWVREQDLGRPCPAEDQGALTAKIATLESQLKKALQELRVAQLQLGGQAPGPADRAPAPSGQWPDNLAGGGSSQESPGLPAAASSQRHPCDPREAQGYSPEQPVGGGWQPPEGPIKVDTVKVIQVPRELEIAASTTTGVARQPQRAQSLEPYGRGLKALTARGPEEGGSLPIQNSAGSGPALEAPPSAPTHRTNEVIETTFPIPNSPLPSTFHAVKKISITAEPYRDEDPPLATPGLDCNGVAGLPRSLQRPSEGPLGPVSAPPSTIQAPTGEGSVQQAGGPVPAAKSDITSREQSRTAGLGEEKEEDAEDPASLPAGIKSIMKRKDDSTDPLSNKKSLQFVGVNGGYESTSSEDSSTAENFSDNESTESEYHEASEGLPAIPEGARQKHLGAGAGPGKGVGSTAKEKPVAATGATAAAAEAVPSRKEQDEIRLELSTDLISACLSLQKSLESPGTLTDKEMKAAYTTVLQEWLRLSCHKDAHPEVVRRHMVTFRAMSPQLLQFIVNMADSNGNTALHYTVSHSNFPVVRQLLDTGLCNVDKQNKAGYTAIMLTALAAFRAEGDMDTIVQLLKLGNVNSRASQAGQTALMLAVSHGRIDMVKALLDCAADVNLQDDDGSTALMCACEHGHVEIIRLLLAVPNCDVTLTDHDGSSALSIALEAGQNDIAVMLYAHMNFAKSSGAPKSVKPEGTTASSTDPQ
ncbi:KN motif and ankyrin repeat domain-containing protein 2 isoform X2 [Ornithorhynchus anatinus]|uniref:KN motif and ankyrin repeat domain-containing protein 2 isoform X2 n=1 Tax=Ornithorhynchus anatinus TaxID=9258 RepID=UPI0010A8D611|nr:KN motif and ankyrin repeat domain-containing protein 2 isoform X2 [Ornithorhynchus anatinus]